MKALRLAQALLQATHKIFGLEGATHTRDVNRSMAIILSGGLNRTHGATSM